MQSTTTDRSGNELNQGANAPATVAVGLHTEIRRQDCVQSNACFGGGVTFLQAPLACSAWRGRPTMRKVLTTAIAAAALLGAAQPAAAIERTYSVQNTTYDASGNRLNEGANARVLGGDATTVVIQLECFVNTWRPAIGTGVEACYVLGADGTKRRSLWTSSAQPGPFDVVAGVHTVPRQHYRVCVEARAWFEDAVGWIDAPLVCSP